MQTFKRVPYLRTEKQLLELNKWQKTLISEFKMAASRSPWGQSEKLFKLDLPHYLLNVDAKFQFGTPSTF